MANDAEMTNGAADKGKAKAADPPKDSKPAADGKKDDAKLNCERHHRLLPTPPKQREREHAR
jgi:hypothetical protein